MALDTTVGGTAADSYATLAEYQARAAAFGWTLSGADATDEVNLRLARQYLDGAYVWKGYRAEEDQALEWPREIVEYVEGYIVLETVIPQKIKDAQMEMAFLIQNGATPFATREQGPITRERKKVDVLEVDRTYGGQGRVAPGYPLVDGLVAPYTVSKRGAANASVPLARA